MGAFRLLAVGTAVLGAGAAGVLAPWGCGSSMPTKGGSAGSTNSSSGASGANSTATAVSGGSSGAGSASSGARGKDAAPSDAMSSSSPANDASDATAGPVVCPRDFGRWDGSLPDGSFCSSPDDTDRDSYPDCIDGCPYDPYKIAPGVCGCNVSDVDSDGDGVPDCLDECPSDPNNTAVGQCGCVGVTGFPLAPAGTPCTDTACPQTGATCNGAGVCGDRSSCVPCPGGRYVMGQDTETVYWFCGGNLPKERSGTCAVEDAGESPPASWASAQSTCASKGLTLARLSTVDENRFVANLVTSPTWLGANDLQTSGQWYWASPTTNSDVLLWEGGPDGSRQNNLYFNWASGAPASGSCGVLDTDGFWYDHDCASPLAYLCEYLPHL